VEGIHEDHQWLADRLSTGNLEVLSNIHLLSNGYRTTIGDADNTVRVTGLGKVYSEATFNGNYNSKSKRHYTRSEFERTCSSGPTEILLLHEPPGNEATRKIIFATRPKIIFCSYYKEKSPYILMNTPVIPVAPGQDIFITYDSKNGFDLFEDLWEEFN
jgi:hypothetical protein